MRIGDKQAIEPLVATLRDTDSNLRQTAASALKTLQWVPRNTEERIWQAIAWEKYRDAAKEGAAATNPLCFVLLNDSDNCSCGLVAELLISLGHLAESSESSLSMGLKHHNPNIGSLVAKILSQIGTARSVEPLIASLSDHSRRRMREEVIEALGAIGDSRAVDSLIEALMDVEGRVRVQAVEALIKIGDARAIPALIAAAKDADANVRQRVVKALRAMKSTQALGSLVNALADSKSEVYLEAVEALVEMREDAVVPLIDLLKHASLFSCQRQLAARVLARIGDPRCVKPLIAGLGDCEKNETDELTNALVKLGNLTVMPLMSAISEWRADVYRGTRGDVARWHAEKQCERVSKAIKALGRIRDAQCVELLISILSDANYSVRVEATKALAEIGGERAVESLIASLQTHEDYQVIEALGKIKDARAVQPLVVALTNCKDSRKRKSLAKALGDIGDVSAVQPLIAALSDTEANVCREAAQALGMIGDATAVPPLVAALSDPKVRGKAAQALGKIGDASAVQPLAKFWMSGINARGRHARSSGVELEQLLLRSVADIATDDLKIMAEMSDPHYWYTWGEYTYETCFGTETGHETSQGVVDCAAIRQLARQELIRREIDT